MISRAAVAGDRAEQDALGADHARRLHRRRRADRHGRRRAGRERGRAQADRRASAPICRRAAGATTTSGVRAGSAAPPRSPSPTRAIRRDDPAVGQVSYLIRQHGQVEYGNQNWTTTIQGVSANYPPITNWEIAVGPGASARRTRTSAALVALIGQTVYRQLFAPTRIPSARRSWSKACRCA